MAAPIASFVQLPVDTGNTGKKVRTQTRVVGADTVHEHAWIQVPKRDITGMYFQGTTILTPPIAAQDGITTGMYWFVNPVGGGKAGSIRRLKEFYQFAALAVDMVPGDFRHTRFTFTGTPTGASLTPARRDATDAAPVCVVRTASTGMTITLVGTIRSSSGPTMGMAVGGAGSFPSQENDPFYLTEDEAMVIRPGEGIVFWSAQALTTANRRILSNLLWDEWVI